ncbi:MAG: NAD(P)-dependent glycerol-3-phosphate dehydrogenase [Lentisphaeria bacterium]|nr:NAD(P)-dependent glycerol-3-phosphate dehydrogenase [Lentisphaeria bacterium]
MNSFQNVTVLGDGAWGTALAMVLAGNGKNTILWGPFPENLREIREKRENKFLKGVAVPETILIEEDMANAVENAELLVLASPSQYMRGTLEKLKNCFDPGKHALVNIAKGIEVGSLLSMSGICKEILGKDLQYCAISGPSHAEEVSRKMPTLVTLASADQDLATKARDTFMNPYFRIYTSSDLTGVELGGALKNVYAVAAGIIDGMGMGDNPKAALMTRAIAELTRLGISLGGDERTFAGLSGIGDLIVTCTSRHSRNRFVGEELGKGRKISEITAEMGMTVAEGVKTAKSARDLAWKCGVETPIVNAVYDVIYKEKDPREAVTELMTRRARAENE